MLIIFKYMEKSRYIITNIIVMKQINSLLKIKEADCVNAIRRDIKVKGTIKIDDSIVYLVENDNKIKLLGIPKFIQSFITNKQLIISGILIVNDKNGNIIFYEDFDENNQANMSI